MAFKKSTVTAAKVAASLSDFPSYVDLSRMGITTLAQAQSLRTYSDEAKLVEQAREIVSATEGHVKIASLTSTSDLYGDYDGIRSDYATTATYGARAVWADYALIWHGGTTTDASGNTTLTASGGVTVGGASGKIEDATSFDGLNDYLAAGNTTALNQSGDVYISAWAYGTTDGSGPHLFGGYNTSSPFNGYGMQLQADSQKFRLWDGTGWRASSTVVSTSVLQMLGAKVSGTTYTLYHNGSSDATGAGAAPPSFTSDKAIGGRSSGDRTWNGVIDELRIRRDVTAISNDWVTTEYNNHSDEASFWGTWVDAGGTPTPDYTISVEVGTFTLTGQATNLPVSYLLSTEPAPYTLAGIDAGLLHHRLLPTETASFLVAGQDANLAKQFLLPGETGVFTVAASQTNLTAQYLLGAEPTIFTLDGQATNLLHHRVLAIEPGAFNLTGVNADLIRALRLACESGGFTLDGTPTSVLGRYYFATETEAFVLEGKNAFLRAEYVLAVQSAGFTLSGAQAAILARYRLPVTAGAIALTGNDAEISKVAYIQPFCPIGSPFTDTESPFTASDSPFTPYADNDCS